MTGMTKGRGIVERKEMTAPGLRALWIGAALTILAVVLPLLDLVTTDIVGDHVRSAYPQWAADTVATERMAIVGWLAGSSGLGLAGWWMSIWGVRRSKRWARPVTTTWFALGTIVACMNVSIGGEAYAVIVPTVFGVISSLPAVAGAVATVQVWRSIPVRSGVAGVTTPSV